MMELPNIPKEQVTDEVKINRENILEILEVLIQMSLKFWSDNLDIKEIKDTKLVLTNDNADLSELFDHELNHDFNVELRETGYIFYFYKTGKIYFNIDHFLDKSEQIKGGIPLLKLFIFVFHETCHKIQDLLLGRNFFKLTEDINNFRSLFGLQEDMADELTGVFYYWLESKGRTDPHDLEKVKGIIESLGARYTDDTEPSNALFIQKNQRTTFGHGTADIRLRNFLRGYELAKNYGNEEAIKIIVESYRKKVFDIPNFEEDLFKDKI